MLYIPQSLKQCKKCGDWKLAALACFQRDKKRLNRNCRDCERARLHARYQANHEAAIEEARQYRKEHKAQIAERDRQRRQVNREAKTAYYRQYHQAHKEWKNAQRRQNYQINRTQSIESARKWRKAHPEWSRNYLRTEKGRAVNRAACANRRARKLAVGGVYTADDVRRQYEAQDGRCYYCQVQVGDAYHADHFIPLVRHGSNWPENIVIACPTCNARKRDKMPDVFMTELQHSDHDN